MNTQLLGFYLGDLTKAEPMYKKPHRAAELGANSQRVQHCVRPFHIIQTHLDQFSYQTSRLMEHRLVTSFQIQPEQSAVVHFEFAGTKRHYKHKKLDFSKEFY